MGYEADRQVTELPTKPHKLTVLLKRVYNDSMIYCCLLLLPYWYLCHAYMLQRTHA